MKGKRKKSFCRKIQWRNLCRIGLRYKLFLVILLPLYFSISIIVQKLEIASFYRNLESENLAHVYHILANQTESLGNTSRSDVIHLFSAAASSLNVEVILIEPSILFTLLTNEQQNLLLKRGSNLTDFKYVPGIVTFGFLEKYRKYITQPYFGLDLHLEGFSYVEHDNSCNRAYSLGFGSPGHYFFETKGWVIHLVEFVRKSDYLWHSALPYQNCSALPKLNDLHFVAYDGIYENFYGIVINKKNKISLPSQPMRFLHEMKTSKFQNCRALLKPVVRHPQAYRTSEVIREMKAVLHPHLLDFWLTSGTLLGWYRECGIISYTTDFDLGMRASDVKNIDSILTLFRNSRSLKLVDRFGLAEEALELTLAYKGVRVDIFFFYEERNQSYVACHFEFSNSYAKVLYPPFSLCSAALMGEKVLVPCETELILRTEYGPNWTQPISKWDWKSSFFNKGPEIHWDKKKQVYQHFTG